MRPQIRTDSRDDGGCKDDGVGPVPVVEGLASSDGDPLASSIGHHLSAEKVNLATFVTLIRVHTDTKAVHANNMHSEEPDLPPRQEFSTTSFL